MTAKVKRGEQWYILSFLSKKCIFRAEKGIFSKSSFYSKMFSYPKYSFSVCQFFFIQSKVNIFHQIQPWYVLFRAVLGRPGSVTPSGQSQSRARLGLTFCKLCVSCVLVLVLVFILRTLALHCPGVFMSAKLLKSPLLNHGLISL